MKRKTPNGSQNNRPNREEGEEVSFRERSPFIFPHVLSFVEVIFYLLYPFPISLLFIFSFPFKSLSVHVIFKFLAGNPTGCGKIHRPPVEHTVFAHDLLKQTPQVVEKSTRHLWNKLFWNSHLWSQIPKSWKIPPDTCGTCYFVSNLLPSNLFTPITHQSKYMIRN